MASINQTLNFDTATNKFHRSKSFQDECTMRFPAINIQSPGKLDRTHTDDIGVLVCRIEWDVDGQETELKVLESYVGKLGGTKEGVDRKINASSKYIRMYKNISLPSETDFFVVDGEKLISLGMGSEECLKYVNYKTSILDPIEFTLESIYSDVDSL